MPKTFRRLSSPRIRSSCRNHFALQPCSSSSPSCGRRPNLPRIPERSLPISEVGSILLRSIILVCASLIAADDARAEKLQVPAAAHDAIDKVYSGDFQAGVEIARSIEQAQPKHPLGYILEAEALWWKIWCTSAEFKYGMSYARHRPKLSSDQHYLDLGAKASSLA